MIPAFLRAVDTEVRTLVETGRAVHLTADDARELEMLAGLPWPEHPSGWAPHENGIDMEPVHFGPTDFAHGWLRLSRVAPDYEASGGAPFDDGLHEVSGDRIKRAAACAELAVIALKVSEHEPFGRADPLTEECNPHDGTIEGARAAWGFVVEQLEIWKPARIAPQAGKQVRFPQPDDPVGELAWHMADIDGRWSTLASRYRRELEAMG